MSQEQLDICNVILMNITEIEKRSAQRHAEVMAMFEDLGKSLITIEEQMSEMVVTDD